MRTSPPERVALNRLLQSFSFFAATATILLLLAGASGCATPGQPVARTAKPPASTPAPSANFPAPSPPQDLRAEVSESAIHLTWSASQIPSDGSQPPVSVTYSIFRAQAASANANASETKTSALQFAKLGEASETDFDDKHFQFGETYNYYVIAKAAYESGSVESEKSSPIEVMPRDTFRPQPPSDLVAVVVPATVNAPEAVDLSWSFGNEQGLAGYNIYRSDIQSARGDKLNDNLLKSAAYRDTSVSSGAAYFYSVTAVDRSGNESAASSSVSVRIPQD